MLRLLSKILFICLFCSISHFTQAQDAHWTQLNTLRSIQNPAENGKDSALDVSLAYRNQWSSLMNAFSTVGLNVNTNLPKGFGVGLTVLDDRAGSAGWHQSSAYLNGSYGVNVKRVHLRAGLGVGFQQHSFDPTKAIFPDQIGNDLTINPTVMQFSTSPQASGFFASYGFYSSIPVLGKFLELGFNHDNFLNPSLSFLGHPGYYTTGRWNAFVTYPVNIGSFYTLKPYVSHMKQAEIEQTLIGSNISYRKGSNTFFGGLGYRLQNAITAQVGAEWKQFRAGIAYDYTVGSLSQNAPNTNGFEFMIGYRIPRRTKPIPNQDTVTKETQPIPVDPILIYTFEITERDSITGLNGAQIILIEDSTGTIIKDTVAGNLKAFVLNPCATYSLRVSKQGYFTKEERISTPCNILGSENLESIIALDSLEVNKSYTLQNIYYDFNEASLTKASLDELKKLAVFLNDNPTIRIELGSHTDNKGDDAYNLRLSEQRAQSCVDYLIELGIAANRLVAKGYGESQPVADNELEDGSDNPEGRALNRRTEFKILEIK
jgi:type IX secretion system PorP/SprF family membrane protein